ncbi:MAG: double zinc ribbon domain-containing protein [Solirubrobacterales bacterium]
MNCPICDRPIRSSARRCQQCQEQLDSRVDSLIGWAMKLVNEHAECPYCGEEFRFWDDLIEDRGRLIPAKRNHDALDFYYRYLGEGGHEVEGIFKFDCLSQRPIVRQVVYELAEYDSSGVGLDDEAPEPVGLLHTYKWNLEPGEER